MEKHELNILLKKIAFKFTNYSDFLFLGKVMQKLGFKITLYPKLHVERMFFILIDSNFSNLIAKIYLPETHNVMIFSEKSFKTYHLFMEQNNYTIKDRFYSSIDHDIYHITPFGIFKEDNKNLCFKYVTNDISVLNIFSINYKELKIRGNKNIIEQETIRNNCVWNLPNLPSLAVQWTVC